MRKEIIEKILEDWNVCSCDNSALADRLLEEFSPEGEYIKKADILSEMGDTNMDILTDEVKEIVNSSPSYSFPDSAENKRDLISRGEVESVLHNNLHALIDTDQLYQLYKDINHLTTYSFPNSAENKARTNGGAIISLYPDLKYTIQNGRVVTTIGVASSFDLDWWNTPYKAESEGE